ncbi:MKRN2 opposite strand, tandem duplicate 1 isoform X2 [Corythoichthys intestinalis]|uniref:MKRN2 opposite strand, tandem duplicate 1 isoform X2 n=1 Tax=Corythoichthys intestinalis TaxID=161448 RepID=UPI0025A68EC9|nr:MKRN2 opposite strand, tandem duplicate 1 isoform X2 [Corythoichthys intestinalis]
MGFTVPCDEMVGQKYGPLCIILLRAPKWPGPALKSQQHLPLMDLRDLLRFSHCGRTVWTAADAASAGPLRCPECGRTPSFPLAEAPVRVRAPVVDGHRTSCCFLVTSREGADGLSEDRDCELHVGISNSQGVVLSYTESGVLREQQGWQQSAAVPLVAPGESIPEWDERLERFAATDSWTPSRFEEQREFGSCCYGFALGFINQLLMSQGKRPISGENFTRDLVLPRVRAASGYLAVLRHVRRHGYWASPIPTSLGILSVSDPRESVTVATGDVAPFLLTLETGHD